MLEHNPKLKELCIKNGKIDGRKLKSKAFKKEFVKTILKDFKITH